MVLCGRFIIILLLISLTTSESYSEPVSISACVKVEAQVADFFRTQPVALGLKSGREEVVAAIPFGQDGHLLTIRIAPELHESTTVVQVESLMTWIESNPIQARKYQMSIKRNADGSAELIVPDRQAHNEIINNLRKANDPEAPQFTFWSPTTNNKKAEDWPTIEKWSEGQAIMADTTDMLFHDIGVHTTAYHSIPKEIAEASKAHARLLLQIRGNPIIARHSFLKAQIDKEAAKFVYSLDQNSGNLGLKISDLRRDLKNPRNEAFVTNVMTLNLNSIQSPVTMDSVIGNLKDLLNSSDELTQKEYVELSAFLARLVHPPTVPFAEIPRLAKIILERNR